MSCADPHRRFFRTPAGGALLENLLHHDSCLDPSPDTVRLTPRLQPESAQNPPSSPAILRVLLVPPVPHMFSEPLRATEHANGDSPTGLGQPSASIEDGRAVGSSLCPSPPTYPGKKAPYCPPPHATTTGFPFRSTPPFVAPRLLTGSTRSHLWNPARGGEKKALGYQFHGLTTELICIDRALLPPDALLLLESDRPASSLAPCGITRPPH